MSEWPRTLRVDSMDKQKPDDFRTRKRANCILRHFKIIFFGLSCLSLQTDYDLIDYLNELREGILEGYQGIIQGLKGDGEVANAEVELVKPYVQHIIAFIEQVAQVSLLHEVDTGCIDVEV